MNKIYIGLGLAFVGGAVLGGGAGYFAAVKRLNALYDEKMEEEIARTKDFYKRVLDKEDLAETAFKAGVGPAAEALKTYQTVDTGTIFAEQAVIDPQAETFARTILGDDAEPVEKNIFDNGDELAIDKDARDTSKPYVVDITEYMDVPEGFDQLQLTYYGGDNILGDDKDEPIPDFNVDILVGRSNLLMFGASDPEQPHVLLVRNEKIKTDFEITHSDGKFAHEVAGLQHSDEIFQRTRPRPRREE
jgi:hypothetical protein